MDAYVLNKAVPSYGEERLSQHFYECPVSTQTILLVTNAILRDIGAYEISACANNSTCRPKL